MKLKPILFIFFAALLLFSLTACAAEDIKFIQDMAQEWAKAKNISPTNDDGSINVGGVINAAIDVGTRAVGVSTGDPEVDAALDAKKVIEKIKKADDKANEGVVKGDVNLVEEAIALRPYDLGYINRRGAVYLEHDNTEAAVREFRDAEKRARAQGPQMLRAVLRDRMRLLNEMYLRGDTIYLSDRGNSAYFIGYYCDAARAYQQITGDGSYWNRMPGGGSCTDQWLPR